MINGLEDALSGIREHGLPELRRVLVGVLGGFRVSGRLTSERVLKRGTVYRLVFEIDGQPRAIVVKRLDPATAQRNQLVATRWLPAVGLSQTGAALLGVAADFGARCIWHVYEDLGDSLDTAKPERSSVEAAVDDIAELHVRFAEHPLLPECRLHGRDLGMSFYMANIRDAIRGLERLQSPSVGLTSEQLAVRDRLLLRLYKLRDEGPDRARIMAELGGPETLLHGDLWPQNICPVSTPNGLRTRLIDWDRTGVGPLIYDLSTLLYRFSAHDRPWVLARYQKSVAPLGWCVPSVADLNLMLETAEISRLANCLVWPCISAVETQTAWAFDYLAEVETWFESVDPAL